MLAFPGPDGGDARGDENVGRAHYWGRVAQQHGHRGTLRGILREHGLIAAGRSARGAAGGSATARRDRHRVADASASGPGELHDAVRGLKRRIAALEHELRRLADADPVVTRLRTIPGIGLLTATALVGSVGHIHAFRRARAALVAAQRRRVAPPLPGWHQWAMTVRRASTSGDLDRFLSGNPGKAGRRRLLGERPDPERCERYELEQHLRLGQNSQT
jgi:hypothetical protein